MISEEQIQQVGKHKLVHDVGMCRCPCFQALMDVGIALQKENKLRARLAKASPEVLAALTLTGEDDGDEGDPEPSDSDEAHDGFKRTT